MAGFDRNEMAALTATPKSDNGNLVFWALVIALPLIGLLVGWFMLGPSKTPAPNNKPAIIAAVDPEPETGAEVTEQSEWSAAAEMSRYSLVSRSLMTCASHMDRNSLSKSSSAFRSRNAEAFDTLREIKAAEWKAGAGDRRDAIRQANNEMMVKMMTGQAQVEALEMMVEFENMQREAELSAGQPRVRKTDPAIVSFLGGEPNLPRCSKLNSEIQRRLHDIKLKG